MLHMCIVHSTNTYAGKRVCGQATSLVFGLYMYRHHIVRRSQVSGLRCVRVSATALLIAGAEIPKGPLPRCLLAPGQWISLLCSLSWSAAPLARTPPSLVVRQRGLIQEQAW